MVDIFERKVKSCGFEAAVTVAKEIATELEIEPIFKETRIRKKNNLLEDNDEGFLDAKTIF